RFGSGEHITCLSRQVRGGRMSATDGPFAETKDQRGCFSSTISGGRAAKSVSKTISNVSSTAMPTTAACGPVMGLIDATAASDGHEEGAVYCPRPPCAGRGSD